MQTYLIIGSGAAGWAAAEAIRRRDRAGAIWLVTEDPHGYYSRPGLAYYLSGELAEEQLSLFDPQYWKDLNVRWHVDRVAAVQLQQHRVQFQSGKSLQYSRLLLATGSSATIPDTPGIQLDGVVKLDNMEDARGILKRARRGETAVVVGGGITALELVEGLLEKGMRVHYFLRGDRYWSGVLDPSESRIVEERLTRQGVEIHYHTNLVEIEGRNGQVRAVVAKTQAGQTQRIPCRMVGVAIGIRPRVELARGARLGVNKGILTTTLLQTSDQDIFAAGDVAEVINPVTGEALLDSLWQPAIQMGMVAGANMAGDCLHYAKLMPYNVTRLAGLVTTIIGQIAGQKDTGQDRDLQGGIMRGDSETWRQMPEAVVAQTIQDTDRLRLYIRQSTIAGALIMGDQRLSRPLQHLIRSKADIGAIRSALLAPQADLVRIIQHFWQERSQQDAVKIA